MAIPYPLSIQLLISVRVSPKLHNQKLQTGQENIKIPTVITEFQTVTQSIEKHFQHHTVQIHVRLIQRHAVET